MLRGEIVGLCELYINLAVSRAVAEIDELFNRTEQERESEHELEAELKEQARSVYARERELLASDDEFELVWGIVREDLLREVRALGAMR